MPNRIHISKSKRFEIFHRDGFICQYCGRRPPDVILELDHIRPVAEGGESCDENLATSCDDCNRGKAAKLLQYPPVKPDGDMQFLRSAQELLETRRFLETQAEFEQLIPSVIAVVGSIWCDLFPWNAPPSEGTVRSWLRYFSAEELVEGIKIAGRMHAKGKAPRHSLDLQQYIWGILRNREMGR